MSAMAGQGYQDLVAWQRAMDLTERVYRLTSTWPKGEVFGLTSQIRRAASSVPANIAEGQGRNGPKEFLHFLGIANGSMREVETYLILAFRLQYCDKATFDE